MDIRQLEYVITIAKERTLLAASKQLYLTPSALSQHISKLEEELKTPLFRRSKSGWTPTYAGQIYIDMATKILQYQKKAFRQISNIAENKTGNITVGIGPGRGVQMFSAVFPKFRSKFPYINVNLIEGTVQDNYDGLISGKIDICFVMGNIPYQNIISRSLLSEELFLVVPKIHPLAHLATESLEDDCTTVDLKLFADDDFMLCSEGTTLRALENKIFQNAGFTPKIAFETPSFSTINMLCKSGYGISFMPKYYLRELGNNSVWFRTDPPTYWNLMAAYKKGHTITAPEQRFIELAGEYYMSLEKEV